MSKKEEYIYKSVADFLGPNRSVKYEIDTRKRFRMHAQSELNRLKREREDAKITFDECLKAEAWRNISFWANTIAAYDEEIRQQNYFFTENSKRIIELLDRETQLTKMLALA